MKKFLPALGLVILASTCCAPAVAPTAAAPVVDLRTHAERAEDKSVALLDDGAVNCSGVWLSHDRILTAYHCVKSAGKPPVITSLDDLLNGIADHATPDLFSQIIASWTPVGQIVHYADKPGSLSDPVKAYPAMVDRVDTGNDLALLDAFGDTPRHDFARLGSYELHDGDELDIVGSMNGMPFTYSHGYVSGTRKPLGTEGDQYKRLILNAQLWFGDSGGGAFDQNGDLAGILDEIIPPVRGPQFELLGVAIHKDTLKEFLGPQG